MPRRPFKACDIVVPKHGKAVKPKGGKFPSIGGKEKVAVSEIEWENGEYIIMFVGKEGLFVASRFKLAAD